MAMIRFHQKTTKQQTLMIRTEPIIYTLSEKTFEGTISWDDALVGKRPGVMVVATFRGQGSFETGKAEQLAKLGYVGFAIDMYGQGRRGSTPEEADALMHELTSDRPLLSSRISETLRFFKQHSLIDAKKTAGIGFCFGGKCLLDLARTGADISGIVSFHGVYDPPHPSDNTPIRSKVLICHGWEDPLATPDQTLALANELNAKGADWQLLAHGHTGHAFTNPLAANPSGGMFYQPDADRRSWEAMERFLSESFGK
jgi:dienelactone hydrolase